MRSIRLSLILYFLGLLGAALGGVAYFCYQSTQEALAAKESSTIKLWEKQFEDNRKREIEDFDSKVYAQARELARKATWYHDRVELLSVGLGMLANSPNGGGVLTMLPTLAEATYPPNGPKLYSMRRALPRILLEPPHVDDDSLRVDIVLKGQYYQTYIPIGDQVLPLEHSRTLGGFVWNLTTKTRTKADGAEMVWDEVQLASGQTVRRVTWKINVLNTRRGLVMEPKLKGKGPVWNAPIPLPGEDRQLRPQSRIPVYLQYGVDTAPREQAIAALRANLNRDRDELTSDLNDTRMQLRTRFLWIGLGAFGALVIGGFSLVRVALSPLNRLSDAVSKVSEKDFHLAINQERLPSELKPIAGRLAETLGQLKSAFEREKQAAADISHELRTPVAALLTTLEIALRKSRSAEEYREVLEDCRNSGQHINKLVERLLKLARLDAGADLLRPREVDVVALADQCVALVRPLAEARGLQLRVHHNGPASLQADPDKLREVLTNLLHNAIEYNRPEGTIDVEVGRTNGTLAVEVRDTGIGITADARQRIFERFFRADSSRHADDSPHAGLGLAIVKGYVDLMGGAIDVDSTVGTGTTFRVRLPVL